MSRVITIDPGKSKCGLVLAEITEKKVYEAIVVKSELLENFVRKLITTEKISQIIIGNGTTSREIKDFFVFGQEKILDFDNSMNSFVGCCSLGTGHLDSFIKY